MISRSLLDPGDIGVRTGLSRNTVRKYLRSDSEEPKFSILTGRAVLTPR